MDRNSVQWTEVSPHSANFILKDLVVESRLELALSCTGGGDIHSGLTTAEDDKIFPGSYGGGVERRVCSVGLEDLEIAGADNLRSLVFAGSYEVRSVGGKLDVVDGGVVLVDFDVVDEFTSL